jgi:hypothetical protein
MPLVYFPWKASPLSQAHTCCIQDFQEGWLYRPARGQTYFLHASSLFFPQAPTLQAAATLYSTASLSAQPMTVCSSWTVIRFLPAIVSSTRPVLTPTSVSQLRPL